jgi:hypothetical protein
MLASRGVKVGDKVAGYLPTLIRRRTARDVQANALDGLLVVHACAHPLPRYPAP